MKILQSLATIYDFSEQHCRGKIVPSFEQCSMNSHCKQCNVVIQGMLQTLYILFSLLVLLELICKEQKFSISSTKHQAQLYFNGNIQSTTGQQFSITSSRYQEQQQQPWMFLCHCWMIATTMSMRCLWVMMMMTMVVAVCSVARMMKTDQDLPIKIENLWIMTSRGC